MPAKLKQRNSKKAAKDEKETAGDLGSSSEGVPGASEGKRPTKEEKKGGRCSSLLKRIGYFSLIIIIPTVVNYAALAQEARALLPEGGVLYDIGWGQKLLLRCSGEGFPTVILESPIGQTSDVWMLVQARLAEHTKVCSYDRAGLGFSDRGYRNTTEYAGDSGQAASERDKTQLSTIERMADDLHRLVSSTSLPKPFLLVSVDFTTLLSRFYTQLYEHEVGGLFLIDPAVETLLDYTGPSQTTPTTPEDLDWPTYWNTKLVPGSQGSWLSSTIGFTRLAIMLGLTSAIETPELQELLPRDLILRKKHFLCQPRHQSTVFEELASMNDSMSQLKTVLRVKPFPQDLPVTIATFKAGDSESKLRQLWLAGQETLAQVLLPSSEQVVLEGEDYLSLYTAPEQVASAISTAVDQLRQLARS